MEEVERNEGLSYKKIHMFKVNTLFIFSSYIYILIYGRRSICKRSWYMQILIKKDVSREVKYYKIDKMFS